jgi:hypothetical protein
MPSQPCPDFALAPLREYSPDIFQPDTPADNFVLVLALAFNDLKAIMWLHYQAQKCQSSDGAITAVDGQARGFGVFVSRYLLGLTYELLLAVDVARADGVLQDALFAKAVALLERTVREDWALITSFTDVRYANDPLAKYLVRARNQAAFHYDARQLGRGYAAHFSGSVAGVPQQHAARAYASLGNSMEETRFYFADAAAAAVYTNVIPAALQGAAGFEDADGLSGRFNRALRFVVAKYVLLKSQSARA